MTHWKADGTFDMDGSDHTVGDEDCCSHGIPPAGETHEGCGGLIHWQPVWGGYYHVCDKCHEDP